MRKGLHRPINNERLRSTLNGAGRTPNERVGLVQLKIDPTRNKKMLHFLVHCLRTHLLLLDRQTGVLIGPVQLRSGPRQTLTLNPSLPHTHSLSLIALFSSLPSLRRWGRYFLVYICDHFLLYPFFNPIFSHIFLRNLLDLIGSYISLEFSWFSLIYRFLLWIFFPF